MGFHYETSPIKSTPLRPFVVAIVLFHFYSDFQVSLKLLDIKSGKVRLRDDILGKHPCFLQWPLLFFNRSNSSLTRTSLLKVNLEVDPGRWQGAGGKQCPWLVGAWLRIHATGAFLKLDDLVLPRVTHPVCQGTSPVLALKNPISVPGKQGWLSPKDLPPLL